MTSIIKVDNLQNQCGANIINENAGTITIGASGDTVTLAAGASQSGFGRSGSVNWDTTPKTTGFTAVSGNGYFCDTTSAAFTVTLPATPAAGDIVAIADYANTAATNNITVGRNSSPIDGESGDAFIFVNGQVYTLVYVDATEGWKTVGQTFNQITTPEYIVATGGTITTSGCGNYKIHTFTGPGTFTVCSVGNPAGSTTVDYLVVAGGGGGGSRTPSFGSGGAGGAGAGGYRSNYPSSCAGIPVTTQGYPITVGGGGAGAAIGSNLIGASGVDSVFSTITSTGGGGGGNASDAPTPGRVGGSGGSGGGGGGAITGGAGGAGNTPPVAPPQGNSGGNGAPAGYGGGSGGGAGASGTNQPAAVGGQIGGIGVANLISGSSTYYAGGGGSGGWLAPQPSGVGGLGGGGNGAYGPTPATTAATAGTANTGGGGGGGVGAPADIGGAGGSGIVIIRYKFQ
jgi:hypothetical protein